MFWKALTSLTVAVAIALALALAGRRELTVTANDTAQPGVGIGKLVTARRCAR